MSGVPSLLGDGIYSFRTTASSALSTTRTRHFIVVAEVADQASKEQARDAMSRHGGHFINYCSRWSTEDLTP